MPSDQRAYRLTAIDMVRGLVIVIMAIDHVRDFVMMAAERDPMTNPNVSLALFATRWVTHFCAPVFVLLAGVSAGLMTARRSHGELARYLLTRGLWLILVEIFIVATSATFARRIPELGGALAIPMQVIWAIGASMVVLSAVQAAGRRACLAVGIAILLGHNLLDPFWPRTDLFDEHWPLWVALHAQMARRAGPFLFAFIYPLLPWIAVMLTGFGLSAVFEQAPAKRNKWLLSGGAVLTAMFIALRMTGVYGDPNPWQAQPGGAIATVIDFLNTTKYPPSLLFLLMTLGPAAILASQADRVSGFVKETLVMFGRVPFAFYIAHFFLIHTLAILIGLAQGFRASQMVTVFLFFPKGYGLGLTGVYAVWALVVLILYPFCRWVASVKARRRDWWLSYL